MKIFAIFIVIGLLIKRSEMGRESSDMIILVLCAILFELSRINDKIKED